MANELIIKNGLIVDSGGVQVTGSTTSTQGFIKPGAGNQYLLADGTTTNGTVAPPFPYTGSALISGSLTITGSLDVTQGITGSLLGTASYAQTASYALNAGGATIDTGSLVTTASFNSYTSSNTSQFAGTASFASTASYAVAAGNGGVTQILAGTNIILSPTNGLGQVIVNATGGSSFNTATGSFGSFYDTGSVLATSTTRIYSMSLSNTDLSNGVFVSSSNGDRTKIKFTNAGVYNIQFSAQFSNSDNSTQDVVVWIRKNGTNIEDSAGTVGVPPFKAGSNGQVLASWNYYLSLSANDYVQMCWHAEQANVITLETIAAGTSPTHPRTPSLILTAQRIDTFLSNTGSFSGSFQGSFSGSFSGSISNAISASYAATASYITGSIFTGNNLAASASRAISSSNSLTASYVNPLNQNVLITGSLTIGSPLTITNPGVGNDSRFIFNKTNDYAWLSVLERSADKTTYEFGFNDNPESSDYFQWKVDSYYAPAQGWMPLQMVNVTTRFVASSNSMWGNFIMPVNTPFTTVNNSPTTSSDYQVLKYTPTNSTTQTLYKDSGTGTGTVTLNAQSYTGANYLGYWIVIDAGGTTFTWGNNATIETPVATGVVITGAPQTLNNGVSITLSLTGHVVNDKWSFRCFPRPTSAIGGNLMNNAMQAIYPASNSIGQVIKGAGGQTSNLQEWQNSSGTVLAKVDALGAITAPSFTGSLFGTASYAQTASYALNAGGADIDTGSLLTTASFNSYTSSNTSQFSGTASFASTASYVQNAQTASYVLQAVSSSYALTASYALNAGGATIDTGSLVTTASFNSYTSSNTSQFAGTASFASTASFVRNAQTASYVLQAVSSSYSLTSSYVNPLNQNVIITGSLIMGTGSSFELPGIGVRPNLVVGMNTGSTGAVLDLRNTQETINSGDTLGVIQFSSGRPGNWIAGATQIKSTITDGVIGSGQTGGGNLSFITSATGYSSLTERMRVNDLGQVLIGLTSSLDTTSKLIVSGSTIVTGSLNVTQGITGSLFGTASYVTGSIFTSANRALSSSYALTASHAPLYLPLTGGTLSGNLTIQKSEATLNLTSTTAGGATINLTANSTGQQPAVIDSTTAQGGSGDLVLKAASTERIRIKGSTAAVIITGSLNVSSTLILDQTLTDYKTATTITTEDLNLFNQATGSYTSAFVKYTLLSGSNARAGEFVTVWNGTTVANYDNSTTDIGNTSTILMKSAIVGGDIKIDAAVTAGWTVKALVTFI